LVTERFAPSSGHHDKGVRPPKDGRNGVRLVALEIIESKE